MNGPTRKTDRLSISDSYDPAVPGYDSFVNSAFGLCLSNGRRKPVQTGFRACVLRAFVNGIVK
jgi:hypothetical protein